MAKKELLKSKLPIKGHQWITLTQYATLQGCAYSTAYTHATKGHFPVKMFKEKGKTVMKLCKAEVDKYYTPEVISSSRPDRASSRKNRDAPKEDFRDEEGHPITPELIEEENDSDSLDSRERCQRLSDEDIFKGKTPAEVRQKAAAKLEVFKAEREKAQYEKLIYALVDYKLFQQELSSVFVLVRELMLAIPDRIERELGPDNYKLLNKEIKAALVNLSHADFLEKMEQTLEEQ